MKASQTCVGPESRLGAFPGSFKRRPPAPSTSAGTLENKPSNLEGLGGIPSNHEGLGGIGEVKEFLSSSGEINPNLLKASAEYVLISMGALLTASDISPLVFFPSPSPTFSGLQMKCLSLVPRSLSPSVDKLREVHARARSWAVASSTDARARCSALTTTL